MKGTSSVLFVVQVQRAIFLLWSAVLVAVAGQQDDYSGRNYKAHYWAESGDVANPYDNYQQPAGYQEPLYHDNEKNFGGIIDVPGTGSVGRMGGFVLGSVVGWIAGGKFYSTRTSRNLKLKFQREQKQLYSQYYNDVYKLNARNEQLQLMVRQLRGALRQTEDRLKALQLDYGEFKQPDLDGDDRVRREEFYIYLSNFPGLEPKDYPRFEDFDRNQDGFISFKEFTSLLRFLDDVVVMF